MATRADILDNVKGLIGDDAHATDARINTAIQLAFDRLFESHMWSRRLRDFTISTVAETDSTSSTEVTVTNGSPVVTSAGTPFTSAMAGRQIAIDGQDMYFFVNSFTSTSVVRLGDGESNEVNWPGSTDTSASWRVFQTLYTLPSDAETVVSLVGQQPMVEYDGGREALDAADPYRLSTGSDPRFWLYAGENSSGVREVEIVPVPTSARLLRGQYLRAAPTLASGTTIPISRAMLAYYAAADVLNALYAKSGDENYKDLALYYVREGGAARKDAEFNDMERLSLPTSINRAPRPGLGADYFKTHHVDEL